MKPAQAIAVYDVIVFERKCLLKASGFGKPSEKKAAAYSDVLSGA